VKEEGISLPELLNLVMAAPEALQFHITEGSAAMDPDSERLSDIPVSYIILI